MAHALNPQQFDARQPLLGALFELEDPGSGPPPTDLLPDTPHFNAIRARFARDPVDVQKRTPLIAAVLALEDVENGVRPPLPEVSLQASSHAVTIRAAHPVAPAPVFRTHGVRGGPAS